jgi:hypothetical protein
LPSSTIDNVVNDEAPWPALPTETEIYILPDGRVVIADLPAELAALLGMVGAIESSAINDSKEKQEIGYQ